MRFASHTSTSLQHTTLNAQVVFYVVAEEKSSLQGKEQHVQVTSDMSYEAVRDSAIHVTPYSIIHNIIQQGKTYLRVTLAGTAFLWIQNVHQESMTRIIAGI